MPPRVALTPELALARAERKRVSDRLAQRRRRARQHDAAAVSMTRQHDAAAVSMTRQHDRVPETAASVSMTPSPPRPPVTPSSSKEEDDGARIDRILEPWRARGYRPNATFWERVTAEYPALDLVKEVLKAIDWLEEPKNAKRKCSHAFLDNWFQEAERRRLNRPAASTNGSQPVDATPGGRRNPGPAPLLPDGAAIQMVDRAHAQRALFDAKKLNLAEKLALAKNGTNGRAHQ